jgi:hypothetical protein
MLNKNPGKHWAKGSIRLSKKSKSTQKQFDCADVLIPQLSCRICLGPAMFSSRVHSKASFSNQNEREKSQQFRIPGGKNRILTSPPRK